jgi:hypothetical protein
MINRAERKRFSTPTARRIIPGKIACGAGMPNDEWIRTLADGRRVKFTNQELDDWGFITAQIEGNKVVYSIVLTNAENLHSREEVESQFEDELKRSSNPAGP